MLKLILGTGIELIGFSGDVEVFAADPKRRRLVAAGSNDMRMWDLEEPDSSLAGIVLRGHDGEFGALASDPGGRRLASW
jgi:hypothetical protein